MRDVSQAAPPTIQGHGVESARTSAIAAGRDDSRIWIPLFLLPFLILYLGFTLWPLIATIS